MSQRVKQVESTLHRAVAEVLQREISDPRIRGMVSVTRVKVSPDLKDATVFVSVLPDDVATLTLKGLRHATRHVQSGLRKRLAQRVVPHLTFELDASIKRQAEIFTEINQAMDRTGREDEDETQTDPETEPENGAENDHE